VPVHAQQRGVGMSAWGVKGPSGSRWG
jgi:hypothetical protein